MPVSSIIEQIKILEAKLANALLSDRMAAWHEINALRKAAKNKTTPVEKLLARGQRIEARLEQSASRRAARQLQQLNLGIDPELPIQARQEEIIAAIRGHRVLIVAGETGSGKTTQLPKMCLAAGRGVDGLVGVTQPRRIAALTVGRRIAEELGEEVGRTVGVKIRFQDQTSDETRIKLMTDGILLAEAQTDRFLNAYDTLIVDEAHERSLNIDFILGLLKQLLVRRRDLKVIITSATIDTEKFSQAFDQAPVIEVSGRMYPVQVRYEEPSTENGEETTHIEQAVQALDRLQTSHPRGDILIFMPTEQDIRDTCEIIRGRRYPGAELFPLFARLSAAEQQRVFHSGGGRKIVVATNVAETSITIPGIRYVIDTGLARVLQYAPRTRTNTLPVVPISRSSADQRMGRCGRTADGVCFRLYSQEDYEQRPKYTPPEILRANLAEVILRMIALGLGDVEAFPFVDAPAPRSIQDGYALLLELGAIVPAQSKEKHKGKFALTEKGRLMAKLPLDPRLACMLLEAQARDCLNDLAIIAAALSIQDPRERPMDKQAEADQAHARFADPSSDFITLLNIWHAYDAIASTRTSWQPVKQFCRARFLSWRRMREWQDVHHQIKTQLAEQGIRSTRPAMPPAQPSDMGHSWYAAVHQSILSGFVSNIAMKKEKQIFQASHNRQAMIFPGSGLFKNPGPWIVAAEMVETSRLFARCAAVIDPAWIETAARAQCKYTYLDPRWERKREAVVATEQVSLFGLIIDLRPRPYGPVNPEEAAEIFIRHALIQGDVRRPPAFLRHNLDLMAQVEKMEERLRRRDLRVEEEMLLRFYREQLGQTYDLPALQALVKKKGSDAFLRLNLDDLLNHAPGSEELEQYPEQIEADGLPLACDYRFTPGEAEDGVTVRVPMRAAGALTGDSFQWLVPGLLKEKIAALIKALPKELRKQLVPVNDTVATIVTQMPIQRDISLSTALSRFVRQKWRIDIPAALWNESHLPDHLRMRIALTDDHGQVVRAGRDACVLTQSESTAAPETFQQARQAYERGPIEQWDFEDLPETIVLSGPAKTRHTAYPALEVRGNIIVRTAFADLAAARRAHPQAVKALLVQRLGTEIKFLRRNLALPYSTEAQCRYFGGRPALEEQLFQRVLDDHLAKDLRTREAFETLLEELHRQNIAAWGQALKPHLMTVLDAYQTTRMAMADLEKAHPVNGPLHLFLNELRTGLQHLVPEHFIALYDESRLQQLPRYLRATAIRAERAAVDLEKDRAKSRQIEPYEARLSALIQELTIHSSEEKRRAVEEFFWMLEEFKISLFAQQIKTLRPISAKRLDAMIREIGDLV